MIMINVVNSSLLVMRLKNINVR